MIELEKEWKMAIDGKLNFCGFLVKYFDKIAAKYELSSGTQENYAKVYENHILENLQARPLEEYDAEDFEEAIAKINSSGHFAKSTIQGYRRLITRVIEAAVEYEGMRNPLWGVEFEEILTPKDVKEKEDLAIPRSMPLAMQVRLADKIRQDAPKSGEMLGLMICMDTGSRLKEAAAVSVADHRFPDLRENYSELALHNSTVGQSSDRHAKMKTSNAYRVVVLGPESSEILKAKVAEVQNMITLGKIRITKDSSVPSIEEIPLVNKDDTNLLPCSSPMLTKAFRKLLQEVGYDKNDVVAATRLVESEEFQQAVKELTPAGLGFTEEKDMTAYISRRQFYTNMYIVGMGELARQYAMGHKFEDPTIDRRDYRNPDRARRQAEEILRIPTINKAALEPRVIAMNGDSLNYEDARDETIKVAAKKGRLVIRINSNEAMTPTEVRIKKIPGIDIRLSSRQTKSSIPYKETVNILNPYYKEAREAYAMLQQEKEKKMEDSPDEEKQQ